MGMHFPENLYVGIQSFKSLDTDSTAKFPLGFLVPDGTDAAARKRKESVDGWLRNEMYDHTTRKYVKLTDTRTMVMRNEPVNGFRVVDDIKRTYFGGGNVVWRIEDPRGFQFEISSANFMALIQQCVLTNGLIDTQCIYARDGSKNALVSVGSPEYAEAVTGTIRKNAAKNFSLKSLVPGTGVIFENGTKKFYLGKVWVSYVEEQFDNEIQQKTGKFWDKTGTALGVTTRYLFLDTDQKFLNDFPNGMLDMMASPKIAEMTNETTPHNLEYVVTNITKFLSKYHGNTHWYPDLSIGNASRGHVLLDVKSNSVRLHLTEADAKARKI